MFSSWLPASGAAWAAPVASRIEIPQVSSNGPASLASLAIPAIPAIPASLSKAPARAHRASRAALPSVFTLCVPAVQWLTGWARPAYGLIRTPKFTTADAPAASVPTLALTVPVLPAAGAVTLPWLVVAATAAW